MSRRMGEGYSCSVQYPACAVEQSAKEPGEQEGYKVGKAGE